MIRDRRETMAIRLGDPSESGTRKGEALVASTIKTRDGIASYVSVLPAERYANGATMLFHYYTGAPRCEMVASRKMKRATAKAIDALHSEAVNAARAKIEGFMKGEWA